MAMSKRLVMIATPDHCPNCEKTTTPVLCDVRVCFQCQECKKVFTSDMGKKDDLSS